MRTSVARTTERGRGRLVPTILGLAGVLTAAGCASGGATVAAPRTSVAAETPRAARPPAPASAAETLLGSMRRDLERAGVPAWGEVLVGLDRLRNQSHASAREFDDMRGRLARLLGDAGRTGRVPFRFVAVADEPVDYELAGTAYLVTLAGTDFWELYLVLRPEGESWTVWRAGGPVRMLRQPRGGEARLFIPE